MMLIGITTSWSSLSSLLVLQNGYETDVGEKSALLSGGQKQVGDAIGIAQNHPQIQVFCCAKMFGFFSVGRNGSIFHEHGSNVLPATGGKISSFNLCFCSFWLLVIQQPAAPTSIPVVTFLLHV